MTSYKHTQIGYLMLCIVLAIALFYVWLYRVIPTETGSQSAIVAVMAFVIVVLVSFASLQVAIDERDVRIKFGYGIFRKTFPLNEITSVKTVKNHWYYGWGIRLWLWPPMWIFNVSGFDAVEITMKNGRIYRIGTDVPRELVTAIQRGIRAS